MKQNWVFMSAFERFLHIARIILSVSIVLLSLLQLLAVLDNALNVVVPLMGVLMIIQAVSWCVLPFVVPDILKLCLALLIGRRLKQISKPL